MICGLKIVIVLISCYIIESTAMDAVVLAISKSHNGSKSEKLASECLSQMLRLSRARDSCSRYLNIPPISLSSQVRVTTMTSSKGVANRRKSIAVTSNQNPVNTTKKRRAHSIAPGERISSASKARRSLVCFYSVLIH